MPHTRKADAPIGNVVTLIRSSPTRPTLPRRAKVNSARIDFPLLIDDFERLQTNASSGMLAFRLVYDQIEQLLLTERRDGVSQQARELLLTQIYSGLNVASRMMNPYRRPRG